MSKTAIAILSFNRPYYLQQVLQSIQNQTVYNNYNYYFFQDGAVNQFSGKRYAQDEDIDKCVELAKQYLPSYTFVADYSVNLGVALNFHRAETYLFNDLSYDRIMFFEDDMILNNNYVEMLESLMDILDNGNVESVTMHGGMHHLNYQEKNKNKLLIANYHRWAYGIYKKTWLKRQPCYMWYIDMCKNIDYRKRPNDMIRKKYEEYRSNLQATSQDSAKDIATANAKLYRVNTCIMNGFYIGEVGLHSTPLSYKQMGWDKSNFKEWPTDLQFDILDIDKSIEIFGKNVLSSKE